jgi:hypothetical protein
MESRLQGEWVNLPGSKILPFRLSNIWIRSSLNQSSAAADQTKVFTTTVLISRVTVTCAGVSSEHLDKLTPENLKNLNYACSPLTSPYESTTPKITCGIKNMHFECSFFSDFAEETMTTAEFKSKLRGSGTTRFSLPG